MDAEDRTVQGVVVAEAEAEEVAEEAEANNHPKSSAYAPAVCYQNTSKLHAIRCVKVYINLVILKLVPSADV